MKYTSADQLIVGNIYVFHEMGNIFKWGGTDADEHTTGERRGFDKKGGNFNFNRPEDVARDATFQEKSWLKAMIRIGSFIPETNLKLTYEIY